MITIEHFKLIDTGLEELPKEERARLCCTCTGSNLIHGWGTDADSALDALLYNLQDYEYEITMAVVRGIMDQYHPTYQEGDRETTYYHLYLHIGCTNVSYESVYTRQWDDEYRSLCDMRNLAQQIYTDALRAEQKRRQPRPEVFAKIREEALASPLVKEIHRLEAEIEQEKETKTKLLRQMAPQVAMMPDPDAWHLVDTSTSSTYRSQGYGEMRYARGILEVYRDMLESRGFKAHICQRNFHRETGMFATDNCDYELWSNCPKWMYDASQRTYPMSAAIASMKEHSLNPFVYNPYFPEEYLL